MDEIKFKGSEAFKAFTRITNALESLEPDKEYVITLKEYKAKRSIDANAKMWLLLDKLACRLHESKEALYKGYIKDVGGVSEIVCVQDKALDKFCKHWQAHGLGWQTETMPSKIKGCTNVMVYYGSSYFDKEQMSRLIDLIVQDCKALDIETDDPRELERLIAEWEGKQ